MTGACRLLWPPLVVIDASCEAPWALSLVDGAKIIHFSAVCSNPWWFVKQSRSKMTRNSAVSCCVCVEYENFDFCVLYLLLYIVTFENNTNVVKVVMVKVVKLDFWKYFSRLKIVYINNIHYLYILSLELSSLIRFRVWPLWPWPLWPLWPESP